MKIKNKTNPTLELIIMSRDAEAEGKNELYRLKINSLLIALVLQTFSFNTALTLLSATRPFFLFLSTAVLF